MKKCKKFIGLCLAAVMSAPCVSALADGLADYADPGGGAAIVYDPSITVEITEGSAAAYAEVSQTNSFVPMASATRYGNTVPAFTTDDAGCVDFTMTVFPCPFNISLCRCEGESPGSSDPILWVAEDRKPGEKITVTGLENNRRYYFRLSSWYGDGICTYRVTVGQKTAADAGESAAASGGILIQDGVPYYNGPEYTSRIVCISDLEKTPQGYRFKNALSDSDSAVYAVDESTYIYVGVNTVGLDEIKNGMYALCWYSAAKLTDSINLLKIELMKSPPIEIRA